MPVNWIPAWSSCFETFFIFTDYVEKTKFLCLVTSFLSSLVFKDGAILRVAFPHSLAFRANFDLSQKGGRQGILTEGEGSVQLTSFTN